SVMRDRGKRFKEDWRIIRKQVGPAKLHLLGIDAKVEEQPRRRDKAKKKFTHQHVSLKINNGKPVVKLISGQKMPSSAAINRRWRRRIWCRGSLCRCRYREFADPPCRCRRSMRDQKMIAENLFDTSRSRSRLAEVER